VLRNSRLICNLHTMCALPLERAEDAGGVYSNIRELGSKKGYTN